MLAATRRTAVRTRPVTTAASAGVDLAARCPAIAGNQSIRHADRDVIHLCQGGQHVRSTHAPFSAFHPPPARGGANLATVVPTHGTSLRTRSTGQDPSVASSRPGRGRAGVSPAERDALQASPAARVTGTRGTVHAARDLPTPGRMGMRRIHNPDINYGTVRKLSNENIYNVH